MIIAVIGAHGAGKSTLVQQVVMRYGSIETVRAPWTRQPVRMRCQAPPWVSPVEVIGFYDATHGSGPDSGRFAGHISEVYDWAYEAHAQGRHVLMEGTIILGSLERLITLAVTGAAPVLLAHIAEPLEVCVASIAQRKAARPHRHARTPVNTALIIAKSAACYAAVERAQRRGVRVSSGDRATTRARVETALGWEV